MQELELGNPYEVGKSMVDRIKQVVGEEGIEKSYCMYGNGEVELRRTLEKLVHQIKDTDAEVAETIKRYSDALVDMANRHEFTFVAFVVKRHGSELRVHATGAKIKLIKAAQA